MAIESRAKWTDLIPEVGLKIREVYDQGDDLYTPGIHNVLNVTGGEGAQQNYSGKTSFGRVKEFEDGDNIPTVERHKTYTTIVNYKNYGGAVEVTKNQIEDRDFNAELDEMKDLSRSNNYAVDESGLQIFNGGFGTDEIVNGYSLTWYGDGVPQFSTVHPTVVPGASTQSNASSTGIVLNHDNLEIGRLALNMQQQDNGLALGMVGRTNLVTPMHLEKKAMETIGSELTPETANNAINVFRGAMTLTTSKFLDSANRGSDTQWFLIMDGMHKLRHEIRQEKRLEVEKNIRNKVVTFTVDARWANYSLEWKGTWGSKGDGASYTS